MSLFDDETKIARIADPIDRFLAFVKEREAIRHKRAEGRPWPWTTDPFLRDYRFCCIERERDRTTREIAALWRQPYKADPDLWFAMAVARQVNFVPTLEELGFPVPWDADHFIKVMRDRKQRGEKTESSSYMIHADNSRAGAGVPKAVYIANRVLTPLWERRKVIHPVAGDTLEDFCVMLMRREAIDSFMAGQIIADLKYVDPLKQAPDWWSFAARGPGSSAGLNRVLGRAADAEWLESRWHDELERLAVDIAPDMKKIGVGPLHNQDLQNALCEFARYEKLRLGQGRARRYRYVGR